MAAQVGVTIPLEVLEELVQSLDALFLFDNERFAAQMGEVRRAWRAQPARPPQLAGRNYPAEPEALAEFLDGYGAGYPKGDDVPWHGRAIISPHIDYQRGGAVYAQVWQQAEKAVQAADLILIFATDHRGGLGSLTLSSLPYATPYGVLPTDEKLVATLVNNLGEEVAFGLELNHRTEHSVELAAVWLHHALRGQTPPAVVPLLIGSFHHFVAFFKTAIPPKTKR